jgi:hypothetical protein
VSKVTESMHPNSTEHPFMDALVGRENGYSKIYNDAFESLREKLKAFADSGAIVEFRDKDLLKRIGECSELRQGKNFERLIATRFTVSHPKPLLARRWAFNITRRPWMGLWALITKANINSPAFAGSFASLFSILAFLTSLGEVLILGMLIGIVMGSVMEGAASLPKRIRLDPSQQTARIAELSDLVELLIGLGYETKLLLVQVGQPNELELEVLIRYTKGVYIKAMDDESLP